MKKRYLLVLVVILLLSILETTAQRPKKFIGNASIVDLTPEVLVNKTGDENYDQYNLRIVAGYPVFYIAPGTEEVVTLYARKNPEGPPLTNVTFINSNHEFEAEVLEPHWEELDNEVMVVLKVRIAMPANASGDDYVLRFNVTSNEIMLYGYKPTPYILIRPEAENIILKSSLWLGTFGLIGLLLYRKFNVK